MSEGFWELNKPLELSEIAKNSFSVISVSSVVNHAGIGIFKNPQDRGKIHAVLGQIGSFLGRVEFQLHASNVCLINSLVKTSPGNFLLLPQGGTAVPTVKDTCLATSSLTNQAPRPHGRDDHAPLGRRCSPTRRLYEPEGG